MISKFQFLRMIVSQKKAKYLNRTALTTHKGHNGYEQLCWEPTMGWFPVVSLMMGVGAVKNDVAVVILAGLVSGACSMAIGEFVSVYSHLDIEAAQMKRERRMIDNDENEEKGEKEQLPNPMQAAISSSLAFLLGALVPLLAAAFVGDHKVRLTVVVASVNLALVMFGGVGAVLGRSPVVKSCAKVLIGGWIAMAMTFGLTKLIGSSGL